MSWLDEILFRTVLARIDTLTGKVQAMSESFHQDLDALNAGVAEVQTGVTEALREIKDLQSQLASGTPVTQEDLNRLHQAVSDLKTTADQLPQASPPPPGP